MTCGVRFPGFGREMFFAPKQPTFSNFSVLCSISMTTSLQPPPPSGIAKVSGANTPEDFLRQQGCSNPTETIDNLTLDAYLNLLRDFFIYKARETATNEIKV